MDCTTGVQGGPSNRVKENLLFLIFERWNVRIRLLKNKTEEKKIPIAREMKMTKLVKIA